MTRPASRLGWLVARPANALIALVGAGILLRLFAMATYWPGNYRYEDSFGFVLAADEGVFGRPPLAPGYPFFLRLARSVVPDVSFLFVLQHLMGVATALLLFAAVRRATRVPWLGLLPAAVVLLNGDQLFLEHFLLSETLFTFLATVAVYCAVRAADARGDELAWLLGVGTFSVLSGTVRTVGFSVVPWLVLWLFIARVGRLGERALRAGVCAAAGGALLLGYIGLQAQETGYEGLAQTGGWALYARTAQFADCQKFDPPEHTERLCEDIPRERRPGPTAYFHASGSPARTVYGKEPIGNDRLGAFGRAAIVHQPLDYLSAVGTDIARYFGVDSDRTAAGKGADFWMFKRPRVYPPAEEVVDSYYGNVTLRAPGADALRAYNTVVRVHGPVLLLLLIVAVAGALVTRNLERKALLLFLGVALILLVVPPATLNWNWRYGIPALGPLLAAVAVGLPSLQRVFAAYFARRLRAS